MERGILWQRASFTLAALGAILVAVTEIELTERTQILGLVVAVILAGLPHGAVDPLVAHRAQLWSGPSGLVAFLAMYLIAAGAALVFWIAAPEVALVCFLVASAWHFSTDWRDVLGTVSSVSAGLAVVALPAFFHPDEVERLLAHLSNPASASLIKGGLVGVAPLCIFGLVGAAASMAGKQILVSVELLVLGVSSFFLPPLVFFTIYFCAQHAPRHLIRAASGLPGTAIAVTVLFTGIAVAAAGLAFHLIPDGSVDQRILRTVIVGLAVLTLPHMVLVEMTRWRLQRWTCNGVKAGINNAAPPAAESSASLAPRRADNHLGGRGTHVVAAPAGRDES